MANELTNTPQTWDAAIVENLNNVNNALPKGFNKERFAQNALSLLMEKPEITQKFAPPQVMAGLLKGAYLGLDFYSKECYLIPYGSQLNFMIDYKGATKLCKKYSIRPLREITARIIREGDDFELEEENGNQTYKHKSNPLSKKPIIGAYAVAKFVDGGVQIEVMNIDELNTAKSKSKSQNSMAWKDFPTEMYKKTVIHRLCKHIDIDFENPTQMTLFNDDCAIETDTKELVKKEISENANSEVFVVEE